MSPPPGGGAVASAVAPYWPETSVTTTLDDIAKLHDHWQTHLDDAADTSDNQYRSSLFKELLQGQSAQTLHKALSDIANSWRNDAHEHKSAAAAVRAAVRDLETLRSDLEGVIETYRPEYQAAIEAVKKNSNAHPTPAEVLAKAKADAEGYSWSIARAIRNALAGKFGTDPGPPRSNNGGGGIQTISYQPGGPGSFPPIGTSPIGTSGPPTGGGVVAEPSPVGAPVSSGGSPASSGAPVSSGGSPASSGTPAGSGASPASSGTPAASGESPASSATPAASGGPSASSGTPVGSGGPSASSGAPVGSVVSTPVSPGGSRPGSRQDQQSDGTTPAGDGSGSGALPPVPLLGGQGQPGAGGLQLPHGMADGGAPAPPPPAAVAGGGGGAVSGGGMMPISPAPGPLAPYSPPGAGSSATPPSVAPASSSGPSPAGPAAAGAGAVIAASKARKSVGAAPTKQVNPDLVSAQRVLAGLVKACPTRPIFWAVSVLRTPVGPQTLIAGSVGGGGYLPPEVSVPSTVQLAVLDPALPSDWAAEWMGWQSPLAILVDHYERVAKVVAGVKVSAMVTSQLWPSPPDCGGDFLAVRHEELVMSTEPPLVGGHRLTATDPALVARLKALDRGGDITTFVGAQLTRAIWVAAAQPDDTGLPIAVKEDADILGLVAEGAVQREHWDDYRRDVERRADGAVMMPEIHAPRDADDSVGSVTARMWYRHYYARGRIAEMVTCWESLPVSLLDIAYCGVAAGFGPVLAAVVTELENQLPESPGPAGGA